MLPGQNFQNLNLPEHNEIDVICMLHYDFTLLLSKSADFLLEGERVGRGKIYTRSVSKQVSKGNILHVLSH